MSPTGGLAALAGRAVYRSLERRVFRLVHEALGGLCLPMFAESGAEALSLFRELRPDCLSLLEPLNADALALLDSIETIGAFPKHPRRAVVDTVVAGTDGRAIGCEAARTERGGGSVEGLVYRALSAWELAPGVAAARDPPALCRVIEARVAAPRPQPASIALMGLMAAGKTETGRRLAALAGLPFVDLDAAVETETGSSVAEIFSVEGEVGFRSREARALERVAASGPCVAALGGGAVLTPENRAVLARAFATVWLHVTPATAARRAAADELDPAQATPRRPLLVGSDAGATLRRILAERRRLYAGCADLVVSTEGRDAAAVAEVIRAEIDFAR